MPILGGLTLFNSVWHSDKIGNKGLLYYFFHQTKYYFLFLFFYEHSYKSNVFQSTKQVSEILESEVTSLATYHGESLANISLTGFTD